MKTDTIIFLWFLLWIAFTLGVLASIVALIAEYRPHWVDRIFEFFERGK